MADNDLEIKFGADASGVTAGAQEASAGVEGVTESTQAAAVSMKAMAAQMVASMQQVAASTKATALEVKEFSEGLIVFREIASGIGEALIAAFAIEEVTEFAKRMGEAAEATIHAAETFGLTTSQIQQMKGEAASAGIPFDAMTTAMMRLDKSFSTAKEGSAQQAAAFKALGIDINGSYTQTELFNTAIEKLSQQAAGPAKIAEAMALFGRNIQAIGPLLAKTSDELDDMNAQVAAYGVVSTDATAKGGALAEAFNTNALAMQGLGNTLTSALAPAFTQVVNGINVLIQGFTQSYNSGGLARQIMDDMGVALKVIETSAVTTGLVLKESFDLFVITCQAAWAVLKDVGTALEIVAGGTGDVGKDLQALGIWVKQTFGDMWDWITKVWNQMAAWLNSIPGVKQFFGNIASASSSAFKSVITDAQNAEKAVAAVWGPDAKVKLPKAGTGTTGDDPSAKPKADKSQMSALEEAFQEEENTATAANGGMLLNMEADAEAYWGKLRDDASLSVADRIEVERKYQSAVAAVYKQNAQEAVEAAKTTEQVTVSSVNAELAATKQSIQEQITADEDAANRHVISRRDAMSKIAALIQQELTAEETAAGEILVARMALDQAIEAHYATNTAEYQKALDDQLKAYQVYNAAIVAAQTSAAAQTAKINQASVNQAESEYTKMATKIGDQWRTTTEGLIEGTTSWQQAFNKLWEGALDKVLQVAEHMVISWGAQEASKTAATIGGTAARSSAEEVAQTKTLTASFETTLQQIKNSAAAAAAAAYNALAGVPLIGPALGAAAAAATFAAVVGFEALASAAGGWGQIPEDQLAMVHKDEMLLPAGIASPLRSAIANASLPNFGAAQPQIPASVGGPWGGGGNSNTGPQELGRKTLDRMEGMHKTSSRGMARELKRAMRDNLVRA